MREKLQDARLQWLLQEYELEDIIYKTTESLMCKNMNLQYWIIFPHPFRLLVIGSRPDFKTAQHYNKLKCRRSKHFIWFELWAHKSYIKWANSYKETMWNRAACIQLCGRRHEWYSACIPETNGRHLVRRRPVAQSMSERNGSWDTWERDADNGWLYLDVVRYPFHVQAISCSTYPLHVLCGIFDNSLRTSLSGGTSNQCCCHTHSNLQITLI